MSKILQLGEFDFEFPDDVPDEHAAALVREKFLPRIRAGEDFFPAMGRQFVESTKLTPATVEVAARTQGLEAVAPAQQPNVGAVGIPGLDTPALVAGPQSEAVNAQVEAERAAIAALRTRLQARTEEKLTPNVPLDPTFMQKVGGGLAQSGAPILGGLALAAIRQPGLAKTVGIGGAGLQAGAQIHEAAIAHGADPSIAGGAALLGGAAEFIPGAGAAYDIAAAVGRGFLSKTGAAGLREMSQEGQTAVLQAANERLLYNPDLTFGEAVDQVLIGSVAGGIAGGAIGAIGGVGDLVRPAVPNAIPGAPAPSPLDTELGDLAARAGAPPTAGAPAPTPATVGPPPGDGIAEPVAPAPIPPEVRAEPASPPPPPVEVTETPEKGARTGASPVVPGTEPAAPPAEPASAPVQGVFEAAGLAPPGAAPTYSTAQRADGSLQEPGTGVPVVTTTLAGEAGRGLAQQVFRILQRAGVPGRVFIGEGAELGQKGELASIGVTGDTPDTRLDNALGALLRVSIRNAAKGRRGVVDAFLATPEGTAARVQARTPTPEAREAYWQAFDQWVTRSLQTDTTGPLRPWLEGVRERVSRYEKAAAPFRPFGGPLLDLIAGAPTPGPVPTPAPTPVPTPAGAPKPLNAGDRTLKGVKRTAAGVYSTQAVPRWATEVASRVRAKLNLVQDIRIYMSSDLDTPAKVRAKLGDLNYGISEIQKVVNEATTPTIGGTGGRVFGRTAYGYIMLRDGDSKAKMLETMAHEVGHVVDYLTQLDLQAQAEPAVRKAHAVWKTSMQDKTVRDLITSKKLPRSRRAYHKGYKELLHRRVSDVPPSMLDYLLRYEEWVADEVAKYIYFETDIAQTVVEKYIAALADAWRKVYAAFKPFGLPDPSVKAWMERLQALRAPEPVAGGEAAVAASAVVEPVPQLAAFKRWFADSKVVDAKGEPLVV